MKTLSILLSGDIADSIMFAIIYLGLAVGLFLALRTVVLWYWKVETIISELKMINKNLTMMIEKEAEKEKKENPDLKICPNCKKSIPMSSTKCPICSEPLI